MLGEIEVNLLRLYDNGFFFVIIYLIGCDVILLMFEWRVMILLEKYLLNFWVSLNGDIWVGSGEEDLVLNSLLINLNNCFWL